MTRVCKGLISSGYESKEGSPPYSTGGDPEGLVGDPGVLAVKSPDGLVVLLEGVQKGEGPPAYFSNLLLPVDRAVQNDHVESLGADQALKFCVGPPSPPH